jgi:hypothetical protein
MPQGSAFGRLLSLTYINDLPKTVKATSTPVLFADDMNVIVTSANSQDLQDNIKLVLEQLNNCFMANFFILDFQQTNIMHFKRKNSHNIEFLINYGTKNVTQISFIKFLGLTSDGAIDWKMHIVNIFSKLSTVSYTIRILK